ncbi:MAG: P1 family peptidase, partial [Clostridia bacterium]|nr:P1 family peptidase [Clostridia bacterium]
MAEGKRIRDYLEVPSNYQTGARNAITDVKGVRVGHETVHTEQAHTGVTVIAPHEKDPYRYPT